MEVTGILKVKSDTQIVSDKFQKRDLVITTEASTPYPQYILMQLTKYKCALLDSFNEGDEIKVQFNLNGREWQNQNTLETKYFNTLDVWKIEKI